MTSDKVIKIKFPCIELLPSFFDYAKALSANGDSIWDSYYPNEGESDEAFIQRQLDRATIPEPPLVRETVYWGVIGDTVVGRVSLRHELNENLREMGGHIGYEVHPGFRGQGVATKMLEEILKIPKAREIGKILLTCNPDNIGSNKTILNNGGVLEKKAFVKRVDGFRNYYWITL